MSTMTARHSSAASSSRKAREDAPWSASLTSSLENLLASAGEAITRTITEKINDNGEEYLTDATNKVTAAVSQTVAWSRKHPVKLAVGVAALVAVSGFLVATMKSHADGSSATKRKH